MVFALMGTGVISGQPLQENKPVIGKKKPNILFILVDDLGWSGLSSYGDRYIKTPNIDQLAKQGMRFTQAYGAPMCSPSRAKFLSGEYGARTGITKQTNHKIYPYAPLITPVNTLKLPKGNYTIANMLHDAGYVTMISGKWNVGDGYRVADLKKKYGNQYFKPYGFDYIGNGREKNWNKVDKDKGNTVIINDFFQFLSHNNDRPFFAYLAFFAPHTPLDAPDSLVKKFESCGFPHSTDRFGDAKEKPTANYLAMIKYLDYSIGTLLARLNQKGLAKNTILVFMSDNGGMNRDWDNCPLRGAKGTLYGGGIRVPLLVRWPGHVPAGTVSDTPVDIIDWYPTFMGIAGGSVPQPKILDGVSLVPLLTQHGDLHRNSLYFHRPQYRLDYGQTPSSAIRSGHYMLIHYYGDHLDTRGYLPVAKKPYGQLKLGERNELYNLKKDPGERHNIAKKYPRKTQALLDSLTLWLQQMDASLPRKNPDVDFSKWYKRMPLKKWLRTKKRAKN